MIRIFTLLAITVISIFQGFAQNHVNYDRDSRWFIGANIGGTWTTQTEVPYRLRGGYGFTFGKSFGMQPHNLLSWDLRARFLHAQVKGQSKDRYALDSTSSIGLDPYPAPILQSYQDSLGYFIPNYRTNLLRGSLELVLNTNRLRQNTGWNLSVFGGVGITGYNTAADFVDNDILLNEPTYDYEELSSQSQASILKFQDGEYETNLVGSATGYEVDWMPSFGFGISKQLHPAVSIGLEHKMTWTRTNLFDGLPNNFDGTASSTNDMYHYTALSFKFHLFDGRHEVHQDPIEKDPIVNDPVDPIITDPVSRKKPIVDIYDPNESPHNTRSAKFEIKANVYYVAGKRNITFKQDGNINSNFSYDPVSDQFSSKVILHPGQNLFEISGTNAAGSDYESVIIVYQKEEEPKSPPIVTITNPPYTPYKTASDIFGLVSTVLNVDSKSQIHVYLNGVNLRAFSYNNTAKVLNASLNLNIGTNTVTVTGTNEVGSDSKTVEIIYERPEKLQPPIVNFTNPAVDPFYTTIGTVSIRASALHVATKSDLTVKLNGNPVSSYSFNVVSKEIFFKARLVVGANAVEITGVNKAGMDMASTTIIYTQPETPQPPIVTFIDPGADPITVYSPSYKVTAKVKYVASKSNITLKINGVVSTLFTYSTSSDLMNFSTGLVEGSNVIEIKGVNEAGADIETTTIIYKRVLPQAPPIVNITYPAADNEVFESPEITLNASVLNVASSLDITVKVNGSYTTGFTYNGSTKVLNLPMILVPGNNVVQITGVNMAGSDSKTRIIKYEKPVTPCPPTVAFINPPVSPLGVDVPIYTITANTSHIDAKSQIVFKQNGELIANVSYTFVGGNQIIYDATLIPGSNVFEVTVENADGTDSDVAVLNFEQDDQPCIIPTVGYISPVPYSTVVDPNVNIDAQINNHSPGTTVELKLNGMSQGYMTYDSETSLASKAIVLLEGSNSITVIVKNLCGTNQATFTLIYEAPDAPCFDPVLTASDLTTFTTLEAEISILVNSSHVADAGELTIKLNGTIIPFTFDTGTGNIIISGINLELGGNTLSISAKTACGGAVLVYTITRETCDKPIIFGVTPTNGTDTEATSIVLNATVNHATAEEIVLLLNGVSQAFSFDEVTHKLSQALSLVDGPNEISIRAENACGDDSKTVVITHEIPCGPIVTNLLKPTTSTATSTEEVYSITLHTVGLSHEKQITATFNGDPVAFDFDVISGNIVLPTLNLIDGKNTVVIGMINDCNKSSVSYKIDYKGCEAPAVIINGIYDGLTVTESVYYLEAVVTNVEEPSDIILKVNDALMDFDYNPVTHLLTAEIALAEGSNIIDIQASGCELSAATATLIYKKPCVKITHTLIAPNKSPIISVESEFEITLRTFGIKTASEIGVKLNGATIPFTFKPFSKVIKISGINLIEGTNTILVSLENDCSSEVVNYTVIYDGCISPVITLGSNPPTVTTPLYSFEATVSNVSSSSDIQMLLNGGPTPFVFDAVIGGLNATFTLPTGDNTIVVVADGCKTASKSFNVNYTVPCESITYTLVSPPILTDEAAAPSYSINLIVQHVNPTGISVKYKDLLIPFTLVDNVLSINGILLDDGDNEIEVSLTNACSSEKFTYIITHDNCTTPTIDFKGNPLTSPESAYSFEAILTDVESPSQIKLTVNNVEKPFNYDPVTGRLDAVLMLTKGGNIIKINITGCAAAYKKMTVVYSVPCSAVTYSLVSPNSLISSSEAEVASISLNTTNVSSATISATLNGNSIDFTFSGGVISLPTVPLSEGSNTIAVSFGNDCSAETVTYTIDHEACETPTIVVNGITDGMVVSNNDFVYYATLEHVTDPGDILVRLNGSAIAFTFNVDTKLLVVPLSLLKGSNSIEVIVDGCETASLLVNIIYEEPCTPPTYTLVAPTETTITVEGDSYTVTLTTAHVTADQVSVKVNGATIPFTFSAGTIVCEVPYISVPTNSVVVTLANDCGTVKVSYSITYELEEEDCVPTVTATFAADNKAVTAGADKELINVILNLDDGSTQLITAVSGMSGVFLPTGAKAGKCVVGVWVRAGCNMSAAGEPFGDYVSNAAWDGACEKSLVKPCSAITTRLISPKVFNVKTTVSSYSIIFSVKNMGVPSSISATVNGNSSTASFDGTRVTMEGVKLKPGKNAIVFTLSNDCSEKVLTYNVSYTKASELAADGKGNEKFDGLITDKDEIKVQQVAPVITMVSPTKKRQTVKKSTLSLKANVSNISGKGNIKILVNGKNYSVFNYSSGTGKVSAVIRLKSGLNMIKLIADNGKKAEIAYYITYEKVVLQQSDGNSGNNTKLSITPKLQRVHPSSSSYVSKSSTINVKTRALNVVSKSDLTLTVNGVKTTNFSFSSSSKLMSTTIKLKNGSNTIRIGAKNGDRKVTLTYTIRYKKPIVTSRNDQGSGQVQSYKKPVFKFVKPTSKTATVKSTTYVLKTKITAVKSKSNITVTMNGAKVSFTFNPTTGELIATLRLKYGANNVRISAKNGNQVATMTYSIKYEAALFKSGDDKKNGIPASTGNGGVIKNSGLTHGGG